MKLVKATKICSLIGGFFVVGVSMLVGPRVSMAQYGVGGGDYCVNPLSVDVQVCVEQYGCVDNESRYILDGLENNRKVTFTVTYKNNGNGIDNNGNRVSDLSNIKASLKLPSDRVSILYGPGEIDKNSNSIKWNIEKLKAGEKSPIYQIAGIVTKGDGTCTVEPNRKVATAEGYVDVCINDRDTASFLVKEETCVIPKTGDNSLTSKTILILGSVFSAFGIRKLARGFC